MNPSFKALLCLITLLTICPLSNAHEGKSVDTFLGTVTDPTNQWIFKNDNGYLGVMKFK